jgi:nucleoside-diphosphate-sugar epimerase
MTKRLAEEELLKLHEPGVFDVVIIRPCLIYGKDVKANFLNLINLVKKIPILPFGLIKNRRDFVGLENLVDFIDVCRVNPKASGQIFLVSDGKSISLTELVKLIAKAGNLKRILIPIPKSIFIFSLKIIGKSEISTRLFSNLEIDITKNKELLNWTPPYSIESNLKKMI